MEPLLYAIGGWLAGIGSLAFVAGARLAASVTSARRARDRAAERAKTTLKMEQDAHAMLRRLGQQSTELDREKRTYQGHIPVMHEMAMLLNRVDGPPCSCIACQAYRRERALEGGDQAEQALKSPKAP